MQKTVSYGCVRRSCSRPSTSSGGRATSRTAAGVLGGPRYWWPATSCSAPLVAATWMTPLSRWRLVRVRPGKTLLYASVYGTRAARFGARAGRWAGRAIAKDWRKAIDSKSFLFGRSQNGRKGILNRGPVRIGWTWNAREQRERFGVHTGWPRCRQTNWFKRKFPRIHWDW